MRKLRSMLLLGLIGVAIIAAVAGSYALSAQSVALSTIMRKPAINPGTVKVGQADVKLTLTLDKSIYSAGDVARVTVSIQNTGSEALGIDNPEQAPELIVYDSNMNQVGTWTRFHKVLDLRPPVGPIVLNTGETYSWTFQWNLGIYATTETNHYQELSAGNYNVQASIFVNLPRSNLLEGAEPTYVTLTSNIIQFSIT